MASPLPVDNLRASADSNREQDAGRTNPTTGRLDLTDPGTRSTPSASAPAAKKTRLNKQGMSRSNTMLDKENEMKYGDENT
jgi:hypothetical protein